MDHYFMYICNDSSISQQHSVVDYIKRLLPNTENVTNFCTGCLPIPLFECNSAYLSVVSFCTKKDLLQWREMKDVDLIKDVISESFESVNESNRKHQHQILSSHINHFADHLPSAGTFKLDVIISYAVIKDLAVSSNMDFAGALYRLSQWHGARMIIAAPEEIEIKSVQPWSEVTKAELLKYSMDPALGALVWRGSMKFQPSNKPATSFHGLQLQLDLSENPVLLDNPKSKTDVDRESEHLILSSHLQVIDECISTSIPPYMILPIALRLSSSQVEENSYLLKYLSNKNEASLIVRLGYSVAEGKPKVDKSLSTNMWQKKISSGIFKFSEECPPITEHFIHFVVRSSRNSGQVLAYPMRDPSKLNTQFYFTYLNQLNVQSSVQAKEKSEKNHLELKLPYLTASAFRELVNQINSLREDMEEKSELKYCLRSVLESAAKDCASCSLILRQDTVELLCEEIDPVDWPERVHLLQKQIRLEKEKKTIQPSVLQNLSPQRNQMSVCFSSADAMRYFESSGEAKDLTNAELISSLYLAKNVDKLDYNQILKTDWPEVMKCSYDDIYYNSNLHAEELEAMCNEMVRFYVQHETSCSCNRDQQRLDTAIPIRVRQRESAQKWRSPVKQRTPRKSISNDQLKGRSMQGMTSKPSGGKTLSHISLNDSQTSRSLLHKTKSFTSSLEKPIDMRKERKLIRQNSLPVRQSPRKKIPVNYSNSSKNKQPKAEQKKQSIASKLPELSIKKLRVAVVLALEQNNIDSNHKFFRPCFKRLFTICQAFVQDLPAKKGRTSEHMQKIADAHVKQVIEFEKLKDA